MCMYNRQTESLMPKQVALSVFAKTSCAMSGSQANPSTIPVWVAASHSTNLTCVQATSHLTLPRAPSWVHVCTATGEAFSTFPAI